MARETIQIFAPIAHRLGVYTIKSQLEDLSFKYLYPEDYRKIAEKVNKTKEGRQKDMKLYRIIYKGYEIGKQNLKPEQVKNYHKAGFTCIRA
jgi:GTP pyrophosphokinase